MPLNPIQVDKSYTCKDAVILKRPYVVVSPTNASKNIRNSKIKNIILLGNSVPQSPKRIVLNALKLGLQPLIDSNAAKIIYDLPLVNLVWDKESGVAYGHRYYFRMWQQVTSYIILTIASISLLCIITGISWFNYMALYFWRRSWDIGAKLINILLENSFGCTIEFNEKVAQFYEGFTNSNRVELGNTYSVSIYLEYGVEWRIFLTNLDKCMKLIQDTDRECVPGNQIFLIEMVKGYGRAFMDEYIQRAAYAPELSIEYICNFAQLANEVVGVYSDVCRDVERYLNLMTSKFNIENKSSVRSDLNVVSFKQGLHSCKYLHEVSTRFRKIGIRTLISDANSLVPLLFSISKNQSFCVASFLLENGLQDTTDLLKFIYRNNGGYFNIWMRERFEKIFKSNLQEFCEKHNVDIYIELVCPLTAKKWYFSNKNTPNVELADLCIYALVSEGLACGEILSNGICDNAARGMGLVSDHHEGSDLVFAGSVRELVQSNSGKELYECVVDCSVYRNIFWWLAPGVMKSFDGLTCVDRLCHSICRGWIYYYDMIRKVILDLRYSRPILRFFDNEFDVIPILDTRHVMTIIPTFMDAATGSITNDSIFRYMESRNRNCTDVDVV